MLHPLPASLLIAQERTHTTSLQVNVPFCTFEKDLSNKDINATNYIFTQKYLHLIKDQHQG
jgi:hypothetical protein